MSGHVRVKVFKSMNLNISNTLDIQVSLLFQMFQEQIKQAISRNLVNWNVMRSCINSSQFRRSNKTKNKSKSVYFVFNICVSPDKLSDQD